MTTLTGGCLCGAVRYEIDGEPVRMANCHCDNCRRTTGSAFGTSLFFKAEDIKVTQGETKKFEHGTDAGNTQSKQFCENCGSPIFASSTASGHSILGVRIGSFDDAPNRSADMSVFTAKALPNILQSDDIPCFEGSPPAPAGK